MSSKIIKVQNTDVTFDVLGFIKFESDYTDFRIPFQIFDQIINFINKKRSGRIGNYKITYDEIYNSLEIVKGQDFIDYDISTWNKINKWYNENRIKVENRHSLIERMIFKYLK